MTTYLRTVSWKRMCGAIPVLPMCLNSGVVDSDLWDVTLCCLTIVNQSSNSILSYNFDAVNTIPCRFSFNECCPSL